MYNAHVKSINLQASNPNIWDFQRVTNMNKKIKNQTDGKILRLYENKIIQDPCVASALYEFIGETM